MKNLFIGLSLAAALLTTSCTTDLTNDTLLGTDGSNAAGATKTITVGIDNNATRIHTGDAENGHMPLYWSEGDVMEVNGSALRSTAVAEDFDGEITAQIEVPAEATYPMTLLYPAAASSNKAEYFYIPGEQAYDATKLANGYAILMGYVAKEGEKASMQHQCGYINVALTGNATVTKVMLRAVNHESISGYFIPTFSAEGNSMTKYSAQATSDGYHNNTAIVINCGEGVALGSEATNFTFALPAANYAKGFELTILDSNNKQQSVTAYANGKEVKAGVITNMPALAVNCSQDAGIYNSNAFIGFIRSVEKDLFIDNNKTFNLRADVSLKDFDRSDITKYPCLINFRGNYTTYNNDDITVIDGHNFAICDYNATITKNKWGAIFDTVLEHMTVQNLKFGKTAGKDADTVIDFKIDNTGGYNYAGVFSFEVQGKVKNCVNNATANYIFSGGSGVRFGAFNGNSDNVVFDIQGCTNNGDINYTEADGVTPPATGKAIQLGGIVSRYFADCVLLNCTNNGNITITTNATCNLQIGGIIGQSDVANGGYTNTGNVTITANGVGYSQIGGIHGSSKGVSNSSNSGKVSLTSLDSTNACRVGGIVGSLASGTISGCHTLKDAVISLNTNYNGGWNSLGGIVGYGSGEGDAPNKITSCTNKGTIDYTGTGKARAGGITGMTGEVKDCINYGEVKQSNTACNNQVFLGGIGGTLHFNTTNCHNYGDVTMVAGGSGDAGGMAGYTTSAHAKTHTGCSVDCTVTVPKENNGGIYFGYIAAAKITMTNCNVYGKVVLAGTEKTVTSDNVSELIYGEYTEGNSIDLSSVTVKSTKPAN